MSVKLASTLCWVIAFFSLCSVSHGAILTFSSRAAWQAAVGTIDGSENFNGFLIDTLIAGGVLLNDGMTISGTNGFIDATPLSDNAQTDIDGTPGADLTNVGTPSIVISTVVSAFGVDLASLNDNASRTRIELYDGATLVATLTPPTVAGQADQFFGFQSTAGELFTEVRFVPNNLSDTFGLDNIEYSRSGVSAEITPEPASLALWSLGALGCAAWARSRKRA